MTTMTRKTAARPRTLSTPCLGINNHGQGPPCAHHVADDGTNPMRLCPQHRHDPASQRNSKLIRAGRPGLADAARTARSVEAAFGSSVAAAALPVSVADATARLAGRRFAGVTVSVEDSRLTLTWVDGPMRPDVVSAVLADDNGLVTPDTDRSDEIVTRRIPSGRFYANALMTAGADRGMHVPRDRRHRDVFEVRTLAGFLAGPVSNAQTPLSAGAQRLLDAAGVDPDAPIDAAGRERLAEAYHEAGRADGLMPARQPSDDVLAAFDDDLDD